MYREIGDHIDLCQGDVIANVVLSRVPVLATPQLYNTNGDLVEFQAADQLPDETAIVGNAMKSNVLIMTQCCDCLRKPFIVVCRILAIEIFDEKYQAKSNKNKIAHIRDSYQRPAAKPDTFYLQDSAEAGFPKSVAYFLELFNIPREANQEYLLDNRLLRLNQEALLDLQFRFAFCFGRFATEEDYMLTTADKATLAQD